VRLGVLDHAVEAPASLLLVAATQLDLSTHPLESVDQLVTHRLQLTDVGDPSGRPGEWLRGGLGDARLGRVGGVCGELRFEAGDLVPQRPARGAGFLFARLGQGRFGVGGRCLYRRRCCGRPGIERASEIARVDAERFGGLRGVGGDLLELRRCGHVRDHEGALPVPGDDQLLPFEAPVDSPRGVHVHSRPGGQLAHAGKLVAGPESAAEDQRPQPPGEVYADRDIVVATDLRHGSLRKAR